MKKPLYLVVLYDAREQTASLADHNLSHEDALKEVRDWRENHKMPAYLLAQSTVHPPEDAEDCPACKRDLQALR
jgi:hypothetical protein